MRLGFSAERQSRKEIAYIRSSAAIAVIFSETDDKPVLRQHVGRARRWLWANALAWAVGMPLIFAGMNIVPWTRSPALVVPAVYVVCAVAGIAAGATQGAVLVQLVRVEAIDAGQG